MNEPHPPCSTTLRDAHPDFDTTLPIRLAISPNGVSLYAEGYGDKGTLPGHGSISFIEVYKGELRVLLWADINKEDPTHIIHLGGAQEDRRQPDSDE